MNKDAASAGLSFLFLPDGFCLDSTVSQGQSELRVRFETDKYRALYSFALAERPGSLSASAGFLYLVADRFFNALTDCPELELAREQIRVELTEDTYNCIASAIPFGIGSEYLTKTWVQAVWDRLNAVFAAEIAAYKGTVELYFAEKNQNMRVPERVFFHLVENKNDEFPFAFLATYATRDAASNIRHMPLEYALTEFQNDRGRLLSLLTCLNRVAENVPLIASFMETGELFHPLRLTAEEAWEFLKAAEQIESAGVICRIPNWWKRRSSSLSMSLKLGEKRPTLLGLQTLISVTPQLAVNGDALTDDEIRTLLTQTEGLALLKGKWVEVDHAKLRSLLNQMETAQETVTLLDALKMGIGEDKTDIGPQVTNGQWLGDLLGKLRSPQGLTEAAAPDSLCAVLRPYQKTGYSWLNYMGSLGFGACLADDMGLGKTVQVLAYLEKLRQERPEARALLIVPASLLGNWEKEAGKFTPSMDLQILHGHSSAKLEKLLHDNDAFLTVTTYGMAARLQCLQEKPWSVIILDEAQAIKNPVSKQTKAVKELQTDMRIAMTGTPIENDLTNLWSLFDFLNKGLLGTSSEFRDFCRSLSEHPEGYTRLRGMISPFMLRRVKTDKHIISDLPDKLEQVDYVTLSKKQIVLYRKTVAELETAILGSSGIQRRGLVLSAMMKLKQICNHPDQYLGQSGYSEADSGKFGLLRELCETIYEKRERVLVFTQFREVTDDLAAFLTDIFHQKGYVIHGGTAAARRTKIVEAFQGEAYVPFLVISVKAGGTGLNLTKASHVIHFDRWWNPAVENQATDRAYRIGQKQTVMVHKLVCRGTVEEKIDELLNSKRALAENVIGSGGENWITELNNEELMKLLRLNGD